MMFSINLDAKTIFQHVLKGKGHILILCKPSNWFVIIAISIYLRRTISEHSTVHNQNKNSILKGIHYNQKQIYNQSQQFKMQNSRKR